LEGAAAEAGAGTETGAAAEAVPATKAGAVKDTDVANCELYLIIFPLLIDPSTCLEINNHKLINGCFN
jgi:hypothetical protein